MLNTVLTTQATLDGRRRQCLDLAAAVGRDLKQRRATAPAVGASLSTRQIWTGLQRDGPNHLGLWLIRRCGGRRSGSTTGSRRWPRPGSGSGSSPPVRSASQAFFTSVSSQAFLGVSKSHPGAARTADNSGFAAAVAELLALLPRRAECRCPSIRNGVT